MKSDRTDYSNSMRAIAFQVKIKIWLAIEKDSEKIAVEIKNFVSASKISEFHMALGQFINYRTALRFEDPERILYLAVPSAIYQNFFNLPFTQTVVSENQLKILT